MKDCSSEVALLPTERREKREPLLRQKETRPPSGITPRWRGDNIPLSFGQEQLWFLDQMKPGNPSYNIGVSVRFEGVLDEVALEQALRAVASRHEALRTTITARDAGQPIQVIAPALPLSIPVVDLRELPEDRREAKARELAVAEARTPFDLASGPLLRVTLLRLGDEEHLLILTMHHIVADGWSMRVLVRELAEMYEAFAAGQEALMPDLPMQYADYAVWQRRSLQGESLDQHLAYWKEKLAGIPPALDLPTDHPRPAAQSFRGARQSFCLPGTLVEAVRALSRREGCTPYMVLLAAFQALLGRYSGQDDLCVGTPIAGRGRAETEGLIGYFVNTLVLRADLSGGPTFAQFLGRVRETALGAYAHQELPFERLVEALHPQRDLSRSPLFQVLFSYDREPGSQLDLPGLTLAFSEIDTGTAKFDLSLYVRESAEGFRGYLEYNADLFRPESADRMVGHWLTLLEAAVATPALRLSELPLLTEDERRRLLIEWNDTRAPLPRQQCLHQLFEAQVERTPDAVALVCGEERLTYQELNHRANRLAHHLREQGVGPDQLVGVCVERSPELLVTLLAILKAGGAYLPLDPSYPAERLTFILDDARVRVAVAQPHLAERLSAALARTVCVDPAGPAIAGANHRHLEGGAGRHNLAYVLYTSGSTGRPKGVAIEHQSVVVFVAWVRRTMSPEVLAGVLAGTSISFDISILELFVPLSCGGKVILAENALALHGLPAASEVTLINTVPSVMAELLELGDVPASVKAVILGGETLPHPLARRVYQQRSVRRLYNLYGPTETTVYSTWAPIPTGAPEPPTIGRPISNTRVYVLDRHLRPVPVGVPGMLYIGGTGVARGYLNRPELTAERFIRDPFGDPGDRLYRTGDLVRWLPSGELEFLDRLDYQLKVRGYRIEPGEIEAALGQHPAVRQTVVVAREDVPGDKRLVAYLVADGHARPSPSELQRFLKGRLPEYMVPSAFVTLDVLPHTPNGKIDRKALPAPQQAATGEEEAEAPRSPVEEIVAGVWAEVLGLERVSTRANFFDLGGHSLLATRVIARLCDLFPVDLPLRALFEAPTVAELARWIEAEWNAGHAPPADPIRPAAPLERSALSFAQQRLWFLDQWQPGAALYNVPAAVRLCGPLDERALERSLREIVGRHEVLRTTFPAEHGQPTQVIVADLPFRMPLVDLSGLAEGEREEEARRLAAAEAREPFDLSGGPLLRARLIRLAPADHLAVVVMHHIASDGWSLRVVLDEMAALYGAYAEGQQSPLPELPVQYADYAAWQRQWLQGEVLLRQLDYWRGRLEDAPTALDLPTDRPRPAVPSYRGASLRFELPADLAGGVRELARQQRCTPYMVLLAAFQALLGRYSGQEDVCVGTPIAGRGRAETEGLVGFFVNTLVMRAELSGDPPFAELLRRVRETCLGAYAHQDLPFERLVEDLRPQRDLSRSPLFQVLFTLEHEAGREVCLPGLTFHTERLDTATSKFDLSLHLTEESDRFEGYLEYSTDVYEGGTAQRLVGHYRTLLQAACAEPERPLSALPLLTDAERQQLDGWNDTAADYREEHLLHRLIQRQAGRTPDAEAVRFEGRALTYRGLWHRSGLLVRRLRALGVGPDVPVGVCMERSLELVVALLGVLRAGGAYAPLDPDYPAERLAFMLEDCSPPVLLTQPHLVARLPEDTAEVLSLQEGWGEGEEAGGEDSPDGGLSPEGLAYVIYTSGSTGRPKGAMNSHRAICNRLLWMQEQYRLGPADVVLQKTPYSFDVSVWEFFWPLLSGARLVLARPGGHKDPGHLAGLIESEGVTVCHFVPSMMQAFLAEPGLEHSCASLRDVFCSGEALPYDLQERFFARLGARLHNLYGPTEAAVDVTYWECRRGDPRGVVPIGHPVANTRMHVLDGHMQPVPVGVPGELYIGGVQLARGYLNRPELTAERFVEHPGLGRLYRTGDVGRRLADGSLEYLGRTDHQVKLRGFRVELGEVEAALAAHPSVREAVVAAREDSAGGKRLVGYVVPRQGAAAAAEELRGFLRGKLPEYMVPSAFVALDALPLSASGKVDRKSLPAPHPARPGTGEAFVAPRTPAEEAVTAVWADVLGLERVGAHDNFFDLGGHSLLATQVISRLREIFQVEVPLRALFESPTVSALAEDVERRRRAGETRAIPSLVKVPRDGELPLSFAQQRAWFLDQWELGSPQYNIAAAVQLTGVLDEAALERSLREIVRRHEVLRTSFTAVGGRPVPVIADEPSLSLSVVDLSGLAEGGREEEARRLTAEEAREPFDLSGGPLLRARLIRLAPADHLAVVVMHHIASDGWSVGVLKRELAALYGAYAEGQQSPLPELPVQYADYAAWQRQWLQGAVLQRELDYWRGQLAGAAPALDLPTDRPRPAVPTYRGASLRFELPADLAGGVRALARQQRCTPYMVLLAAFQALLGRYSGQEDVCVGTPIAGRGRAETEGLVGFFVNTLVMRAELSGDPPFAELLRRVRETCLGAYAHQDLPFERLVEDLRPQRDLSRPPLFQVMFVLQNAPEHALELPGLQLAPADLDTGTSKFDLTLRLTEWEGGLQGELEYSTDVYEGGTAQRLVGHYRTLLQAACAEPERPLSALPLLTDAERQQLDGWNDTAADYREEHLLHRLIQRQAGRTPDAEAVRFEGRALTYRGLWHRSGLLVRRLRALGVGPDVPVGVCMERSLELVVALLGVLRAGGAYAPLDPDYPAERLAFMLEDCSPPVLLTQPHLVARLPEDTAEVLSLQEGWGEGEEAGGEDSPDGGLSPEGLAYVIYTSGSTGRPKGAMNSHRAICNRLLWMQEQYRLGPADVVLQKTPYSFDVSVWEFFWPLLSGARLVLARPGGHKDPGHLAGLIESEGVTVCHFVPSMMQAFLAEPGLEHSCASLRDVFCSGEALPYDLQERFFARLGARLHNLYGPTEAAVDVTYWECRRGDPRGVVPIGHPVANTRMHVLDGHMQPVPVGVPGELYIGGVQLARGYLNRPELTAERFVEHPGLGRLYRTGDVGRRLADGSLEYLGRTDHQVKLRGFRVELGEVEAALAAHPSVREAVVAAREDSAGGKRLVGYVVPRQGAAAAAEELRGFLRGKLPEYMVPSAFVALDALPLSASGKVDRKSLPDPARPLSDNSVAPRGPVEETVARIWADVLGLERVGAHDNFFDLGGHSLLATQVISRLRQAFPVDLPLRRLFEEPTVANLARAITESQGESADGLIGKVTAGDDDQFLSQLDGLSDEQVDALLRQELAEEESNR